MASAPTAVTAVRAERVLSLLMALAVVGGCVPAADGESPPVTPSPSQDPSDWDVDTSVTWVPQLSEPRWAVPDAMPDDVPTYASNNNVGIVLYDGRLFMGFRTAETHWASENTVIYVVSSPDMGASWEHEATYELGSDAREPLFYVHDDVLTFTFFQGGTNMFAFEPVALWKTTRHAQGDWSELEQWGDGEEVVWDIRRRHGRLYRTSYKGNHYGEGPSDVDVRFMFTDDGETWEPVEGGPVVYNGGCSESSWELDLDGRLWAVLRNEDGDDTGFGSLLCTAPPGQLAPWDCPSTSDPERYDSPRMFRHGADLYLVARRDIGGPFDQGDDELDLHEKRRRYAAAYWDRPKRTALYRINTEDHRVEHLLDFPSAGDTAFPSIVQTDAHTFVIANYTSPPDDPDRTWIEGQGALDGTQIYLITLTFVPEE